MHSADEFGVQRTNRFDTDGEMMRAGRFDWVYKRILETMGAAAIARMLPPGAVPPLTDAGLASDAAAVHFRRLVEFNLLHEFTPSQHFDWHVDTKPGDGKACAPSQPRRPPPEPSRRARPRRARGTST